MIIDIPLNPPMLQDRAGVQGRPQRWHVRNKEGAFLLRAPQPTPQANFEDCVSLEGTSGSGQRKVFTVRI